MLKENPFINQFEENSFLPSQIYEHFEALKFIVIKDTPQNHHLKSWLNQKYVIFAFYIWYPMTPA